MLQAPDVAARNAVIAAHLGRMERQLEQTQATVASLRSLLEHRAQPIIVEYRTTQAARALAITDRISMADAEQWWCSAFDELRACRHLHRRVRLRERRRARPILVAGPRRARRPKRVGGIRFHRAGR